MLKNMWKFQRLKLFFYGALVVLISYLIGLVHSSNPSPLYLGVALEGYPIDKLKIEGISQEMPWQPQLIVFYLQWPSPQEAFHFPRESLEAIWERGAIPCLTWEPMSIDQQEEIPILFESVLGGTYDGYLNFFAKAAADWNKPFIIRFGHEMNIKRYHWGTSAEDYNAKSPQIYSETFKYLVKKFRANQAFQVLWAFNPNVDSIPNSDTQEYSWNQIQNYYPGDEFVDILGLDGYNWGTSKAAEWNSTWRSFKETFSQSYQQIKKISPNKPIIIFETASIREGLQGNKHKQEEWLRQAIQTCQEWKIVGFVWFQINKEVDWRLPLSLKEYSFSFSTTPLPQEWLKMQNRKVPDDSKN